MVNEFCGFKHGVIGTDKMPADTTLSNMKKADLIKLLHTAQHNYETLMWFYNNAVKVNMSQLNNNGWIPCSERLPEDDCWCVVYTNTKEYYLSWFENGKWMYDHDEIGAIDVFFNRKSHYVVEWQPLHHT